MKVKETPSCIQRVIDKLTKELSEKYFDIFRKGIEEYYELFDNAYMAAMIGVREYIINNPSFEESYEDSRMAYKLFVKINLNFLEQNYPKYNLEDI